MPVLKNNASPTASEVCHHLVWGVKYRRAVLGGDVARRVEALVREEAARLSVAVVRVAVAPDHVHVAVRAPATLPIPRLVNQLKGVSSRRIGQEYPELHRQLPHLWAGSYYAGTVDDPAVIAAIAGYIARPGHTADKR